MADKLKPVTRERTLIVLKSRNKGKDHHGGVQRRIGQVDMEELIYLRRELAEAEEKIAIALSTGASVEPGVHTAKLRPVRKNGRQYLRLVVR